MSTSAAAGRVSGRREGANRRSIRSLPGPRMLGRQRRSAGLSLSVERYHLQTAGLCPLP